VIFVSETNEYMQEEAEIMSETSQDRLYRQQSALAAFGNFARHESNLDIIFAEAARVCAAGLASRHSKISRFRSETNDLLLESGCGWQPGIVGHFIAQADVSTPQGRAFITGKPSICNGLRLKGDFDLPSLYIDHGILAAIYVMIRGNGMPFGVLGVDDDKAHVYDEHDVDFLSVRPKTLRVLRVG
jgi:hypothetical protein